MNKVQVIFHEFQVCTCDSDKGNKQDQINSYPHPVSNIIIVHLKSAYLEQNCK